MSTSLIATLAALGLLALLGVALFFVHLCGLAGEKLVSTLVQPNPQEQNGPQASPALTPTQAADLAEAERIDAIIKAYDRSMHR